MKKWRKVIPVIALALMSAAMTGCAGKNDIPSAPYFTKGVYLNYEGDVDNPRKDNFYVFIDETSGHTDDVISGLPFECEQKDGSVKFYMGGPDPESQMILTIEAVGNGSVTGHFKDGKKQVFVPVNHADPDTFDAEVYLAGSDTGQEQNTELVNPWEYDLTAEEVKERTGCEFIVPEGAYDVAFAANKADGIAEMDFTMDEVKYNARMKATEDYEDISGAFYEWDAEGVDEVGNAMADVRIYTPDNVCNVIWLDRGMMYSLFTIGVGDTETVKMANLVFAGGGSRSQDNEESDNEEKPLTDISLGTSGFIISIPSDYYNGEVTKDDRKDDQIAYYKSDEHLMDFDIYQFEKEGMTLKGYAESEADEYKADKVEEVVYNGVSMMLYYSKEEYEGKSYRVSNYIFENDTDFVELSFWLDGDDAEDIVEQILFSIYMDPGNTDDGVMHAS